MDVQSPSNFTTFNYIHAFFKSDIRKLSQIMRLGIVVTHCC